MLSAALLIHLAHATSAVDKIQVTRASISEDERRQREALSHLFLINKKVRSIARRQDELVQKVNASQTGIRELAAEVADLEQRADAQKEMLNKRLRQLYQERNQDNFHWLFLARSPVELERDHRFLRRMIDGDHKQLKRYLGGLTLLKSKRVELKSMVSRLVGLQKETQSQEKALSAQLEEKSKYLEGIKKSKDIKLSELTHLRHEEATSALSYAFFERRGQLRAPLERRPQREFGTYVDPTFRFRMNQKGLFYNVAPGAAVKAIYGGSVAFAGRLPGYGQAVILDHGDNYYSIYAFATRLYVVPGASVQEGEVLALSGTGSPLFGPGLYFEIRHFTDTIDPRGWIKDSVLKTADLGEHQ